MDAFLAQAIRDLAGQGTGYLLAVLSWAVVIWLFKDRERVQGDCEKRCDMLYDRLQKEREAATASREMLQEKRLVETRETLVALNELAKAQGGVADSITARTETLQTIATLVTQIERDIGSQFQHWQLRVSGIEDVLKELRGALK